MKRSTEDKIKLGAWAAAFGAAGTMIVGFAWGGWTTSGTVKKMTDDAVMASHVKICGAQFMNAAKHSANLDEMMKLPSYERGGYIEKGGWDRVPGEEKAIYSVSRSCAEAIEASKAGEPAKVSEAPKSN